MIDHILDVTIGLLLLVDIYVMRVHRNAHKQYVRGFVDGVEHCTNRIYAESGKRERAAS